MKSRPDGEASLHFKFCETMKLLNVYLNHFPKHEKHALCQRIRNTAYEIYDYISEGQKRHYKKTSLTALDIAHEKLRMQIYLAYELGYFKFKDGKTSDKDFKVMEDHRYTTISGLIDELGRMIGAWIKKVREINKW